MPHLPIALVEPPRPAAADAGPRAAADFLASLLARSGPGRTARIVDASYPVARHLLCVGPLGPLDDERASANALLASQPYGSLAVRIVPHHDGASPIVLPWYRSTDWDVAVEWTGRLAIDEDNAVLILGSCGAAVWLTATTADLVPDALPSPEACERALARSAAAWAGWAGTSPAEAC